ncbi:hypothetical protein [Weissella minor]|uniref:hypothetical protein n=1 Tax=Weissella minor TaxID=1620 RepID=UPI003AF244E0
MTSHDNALHSSGPIPDKIRTFENEHSHIDPFILEGTITAFMMYIQKKQPMDDTILKLNWLGFIQENSTPDSSPHSKKLNLGVDKEKVISNYEKWLFARLNQSTTNLESALRPEIAAFVITDSSENYFELLKNWEISEYGSWHNTKKTNIKKYLKKNHLN